jgi:hypothetical protein
MLWEKIQSVRVEIASLAGTVPEPVWERLKVMERQLKGVEHSVGALEVAVLVLPVPYANPKPVTQ